MVLTPHDDAHLHFANIAHASCAQILMILRDVGLPEEAAQPCEVEVGLVTPALLNSRTKEGVDMDLTG